jgi:hypothetical protein
MTVHDEPAVTDVPAAPAPATGGLTPRHVRWLSVVALVLVLVVTYFLVPAKSAPFIYEFF